MRKPYLRDGVDIYIEFEASSEIVDVVFVFLSTRKRIHLKVKDKLAKTLPLMNGDNSELDLYIKSGASLAEISNFIGYLEDNGIVVSKGWIDQIELDQFYKNFLEKQLYFLLDILNSPSSVQRIQSKIQRTRVAIVGIGSIGSWMLVELIQMGFEKFKIFDMKEVQENSISRHAFFDESCVGQKKIDFYKKIGTAINPRVEIENYFLPLTINDSFLEHLLNVDLIINCADEPYIGYSSIFLSRFAVKHEKMFFVAGGFDAHLGCLGEFIIPFKTPCSDCYNKFFRESLKGWKPLLHPVKDRTRGFGGLPSLSVFSASAGCLSILRYFLDEELFLETAGGRGEFKFDDYSIDAFGVLRDLACEVCGERSKTNV